MAYVLSSISGNLISAASAGYAPTNSADVSAIASAYQVVSATATQLNAGTAYVTSINDTPISAARAGNAANASLANSAYYDGTGRLISALPDSAAVSAIASSYVESGVSGKQDTLSFAYNAADQISSINGSALGGMDEAAVSGIASAYAESAVSSKADSSALSSYIPYSGLEYYDTAISGIDGSTMYDYSAHARITTVAGRVTSISANMSSYVPYSSLEYNTASAISGINGSALAAGSTYSAGEGIDITDDVISVEAPVDIVAGPGIVIDNPDGNTLRVSTDENYETVLWSGTPTNSKTLTEPMWNFERIRIEFYDGIGQYSDPYGSPVYAEISVKTTSTHFNVQHVMLSDGNFGSDWEMHSIDSNGTGVTLSHMKRVLNGWSQGSFVFQTPNASLITKIVGIHRIQGGN